MSSVHINSLQHGCYTIYIYHFEGCMKVEWWKMLIAHHNCHRCKSINYYDRHIWVRAYQVLLSNTLPINDTLLCERKHFPNTQRGRVKEFLFQPGSLTQLTHFKSFFFCLLSVLPLLSFAFAFSFFDCMCVIRIDVRSSTTQNVKFQMLLYVSIILFD